MPKVVINEERCKGCALCTIACPKGLVKISGSLNRQGFLPVRVSEDDLRLCTSCALCAQICPDVAITVHRQVKGARS